MKNALKYRMILGITAILFSGCLTGSYTTLSTVSPTVTFQSFYDDLMPYGTWIDYPGYGQVWHPRAEDDFRPYASNGNWVYSNEGWGWESNYNWGWAPFHYGRWLYDDLYGWLWIPGYEWSPAWVTWGDVDDYYAWAPLMPDVNINIQFGNWRPHNFYWNVCPRNNIYDRDLFHKIERPDRIRDFGNRVNIINNFNTTRTRKQFYSKGPEARDVERYSNRKVDQVILKTVKKVPPEPQEGNIRKVFRPSPVQIPQPREYRRVENNQTNPVRNNEQRPARQKDEQIRNIEKLPVYKPIEEPRRETRNNESPRNKPADLPKNKPIEKKLPEKKLPI
jgi:hypothetical protein